MIRQQAVLSRGAKNVVREHAAPTRLLLDGGRRAPRGGDNPPAPSVGRSGLTNVVSVPDFSPIEPQPSSWAFRQFISVTLSKMLGCEAAFGRWAVQDSEHPPGHVNDAFLLVHPDAELYGGALRVPPGVGRKAEEHGPHEMLSTRVLVSVSACFTVAERLGIRSGKSVRRGNKIAWRHTTTTAHRSVPVHRSAHSTEQERHNTEQPTHRR